jgi:pimeloyl-ACP methyl ester carboxylesterase
VETVVVDGQRVAYRAAGSGAPLVLLHGGLVDSRAWRREIEALSAEFHVIAWDAPGCGRSSDPPADVTLDDYADTVAALLDTLDVGPAHVLGHSFGGGLALAVYERHARLVRSLILESAFAGWSGSLPPEEVEERRQRAERNARRPTEEWIDEFLATLFDETTPRHLVDETRETRRPVAEAMAAAIPGTCMSRRRTPSTTRSGRSCTRSSQTLKPVRCHAPRGKAFGHGLFEPERFGCRAERRDSSRARAVAG